MKLQWNQIDWKKAEEQVNRLQIRIVKATLEQKLRLVKRLQYLITNSFYAKALAVKRVVSNRGKKTPGIDGEIWKSDKEKVNAVRSLDCQTYHAKPLKRVYIEKFGKKEKRPLGIPTMRDRAMQALQLLALEPVAETTADRISFGFRKYRSPEDAREYAFSVLSRKDSPQWILEGDIKSCFDKISHRWMMDNIPGNKRIMKEFMRCGYVEKGKLYPTIEGSPQGGVISPTYANMVLDGLEPMILDVYWRSKVKRTFSVKYNAHKVHVVRFMRNISRFIEEKLGLKVNMTKSKVDRPNGLKYLGFGFYFDSRAHQFKAKPHAKSIAKFKKRMKGLTCRSWGVSNSYKVEKLNQLIRGWINYFKIGSMKILCAKLDANIRYRLRMCIWKHWKTPQNRAKNLMKLGIDRITAYKVGYCSRAYAHVCSCGAVNIAITNKRLASFGLISMLDYYTEKCVTC